MAGHARKKIELLFSDDTMGCDEYGYIPCTAGDPDDDDLAYERYLRRVKGVDNARVYDGVIHFRIVTSVSR